MSLDWAFISVAAVTVLCALVCWLVYRVGYKDGHEAGRHCERNRANERRLASARNTLLYDADARTDWGDLETDREVDEWLTALRGDQAPADNWTTGMLTRLPDNRRPSADTGSFRADMVRRTDAFIAQMTSRGAS